MTIPEVSIIVTNYNYGKFIDRCLRSCLNQTEQVEVIVVDDCSTDETKEVIKPFLKDITFIENEKNLGVAGSANVGIRAARGRFVFRVDADDYISKDMAYFMKTYLQNNRDAFCVSCDYTLVDEHEEKIERKYAEDEPVSCGIMYRKDLLLEHGAYNEDFRHREEEELRKRLGEYYKIHHLRIPFYRYRRHSHNKTLSKEYKELTV